MRLRISQFDNPESIYSFFGSNYGVKSYIFNWNHQKWDTNNQKYYWNKNGILNRIFWYWEAFESHVQKRDLHQGALEPHRIGHVIQHLHQVAQEWDGDGYTNLKTEEVWLI